MKVNVEKFMRLGAAVLTSTLCVLPLYVLISAFIGDLNNDLLTIALTAAVIVAFIGVTLFGLPVHFFLVWRRMTNPVHYAIPGFLIPASFVATLQPFGADGAFWITWQASLMGCFGTSVALVFRRVALGKEQAK